QSILLQIADSMESRTPGELLLLCELLPYAGPSLRPFVTRLLRTCWKTGIYHLRLDALQMAERNARDLEGPEREELTTYLTQTVKVLSACNRRVAKMKGLSFHVSEETARPAGRCMEERPYAQNRQIPPVRQALFPPSTQTLWLLQLRALLAGG